MEDDKKNLLYQPNLKYEKNYYTEGYEEQQKQDEIKINSDNSKSETNNIHDLVKDIKENGELIPDKFKNIYLSPFVGMHKEFIRLENLDLIPTEPIPDDKDKDDDPEPHPHPEPIEPILDKEYPTNPDPDPPDPFDKGDDIYVDIINPNISNIDFINKIYVVNFIDVYKDYLSNLNNVLNDYIFSNVSIILENPLTDHKIEYTSKNINNKQSTHLTDYITKSNILINETLDLHKKLYDIDSTILHIKSIRIAASQLDRYKKIEEFDEKDGLLEFSSNILLEESKRIAEKKYKENFLSLYKYLNSSVILLKESLKMIKKQNLSILTINKYEEGK